MKKRPCSKKAGFTLVELMVAIALGSLLITGIYSLFIMQNHSYASQNNVADMQQNVRLAMSILSSDLRMAGYGFSANGDYKKTATTVDYAVFPTNSTSAPDTVILRYGINPTTLTAALPGATSNGTLSVSSISGFANQDYVILSDGQDASRLQINGNPSGTSLPFAGVSPSHLPPSGFGIGSWVYKLNEVRYRISNNTLQSSTDFGVSWQNVVNNIEDLQLAYRGTATPAGTWVDNPSPVNQTTLNNIQVSVLARAGVADTKFTGQRPQLRDHATGPSDNFRRRVLTSTVRTRNL